MILSEYDEQQHIENEKRWSFEEGLEEGLKQNQRNLISKKLAKGQTLEQIADALEESVETIKELITKYNLA